MIHNLCISINYHRHNLIFRDFWYNRKSISHREEPLYVYNQQY